MFSHRIRRLISNLTHQVHSYVPPENAKSRWIQRIKKNHLPLWQKGGWSLKNLSEDVGEEHLHECISM